MARGPYASYTVMEGDTLYGISVKKNISLSSLLKANPTIDVYNMKAGDVLCLPVPETEMNKPEKPDNPPTPEELAQGKWEKIIVYRRV